MLLDARMCLLAAACQLACVACLPACLPVCLPACLPTCLPDLAAVLVVGVESFTSWRGFGKHLEG